MMLSFLGRLTTQAQRRRPRGAPIAATTARRRSLQRMATFYLYGASLLAGRLS